MLNPANSLAADLFCSLVGEGAPPYFEDGERIRSLPHTNYIDVKMGEDWYRISVSPVDFPLTLEEHNEAVVEF